MIGGAGDDTIVGTAANNRLVGGPGDDLLRGKAGDDVLVGGPGRDWLFGDAGSDTADYSDRTASLHISLDGRFDDGERGERDNVFPDVENVVGGSGNDVIVGSSRANRLEGRGGNDTITGGAGADRLYGGDGDDTLDARDGITDAVLDGGAGTNDRARKDPQDPAQSVEILS
jgi:Ca2+-binding RTX toxin-like protein